MPQRTQRSYFRENTKVINADGSIQPGDRFLATDEPTEETFKRLIESVAFINELADRAKESEQGLVRVVSDANAKAGTTPADGATYAAQVKNLPKVSNKTQTIKDLSAVLVSAAPKASVADKNDYEIGLSPDFINWLSTQLDTINSALGNINVPDISGLTQTVTDNSNQLQSLSQSVTNFQQSQTTQDQAIASAASAASAAQTKADANEQAISSLGTNDGAVVGELKFMPVEGAPDSTYLECLGQAVSRTTYAALFAKIGTTFGAGNGSTTFTLPDFSGKGLRGHDAANETKFGAGTNGGSDEITIADVNLPDHSHTIDTTASIPLSDGTGSDATKVAKGDSSGSDVLNVDIDATTESSGVTSPQAIDITNPFLTVFAYIKAS